MTAPVLNNGSLSYYQSTGPIKHVVPDELYKIFSFLILSKAEMQVPSGHRHRSFSKNYWNKFNLKNSIPTKPHAINRLAVKQNQCAQRVSTITTLKDIYRYFVILQRAFCIREGTFPLFFQNKQYVESLFVTHIYTFTVHLLSRNSPMLEPMEQIFKRDEGSLRSKWDAFLHMPFISTSDPWTGPQTLHFWPDYLLTETRIKQLNKKILPYLYIGANPNLRLNRSSYDLWSLTSDLTVAKTMMEHGANVNRVDQFGNRSLDRWQRNSKVLELIKAHGGIHSTPGKKGLAIAKLYIYPFRYCIAPVLLLHIMMFLLFKLFDNTSMPLKEEL